MFKKKSVPPPASRQRQVVRSPSGRAATVFSYHASRAVRPGSTPRGAAQSAPVTAASVKRHNAQRTWFRRTPLLLAGLALLVITVLNLPLSHDAQVVSAKDASGHIFLRPTAVYAQAAQQLLGSSLWNTNKLTFHAAQLEAQLRHQFPELAAVRVSVPVFGSRPIIYLTPAVPALVLTTNTQEGFVVDQSGRAVLVAAQVPGLLKLNLPVVKDGSGLPVKLGRGVLPSTTTSFITEVVGQLRVKHIEVDSLTLPGGTSELDVKVRGLTYIVKYNLQGNARAEVGTYLAVKQYLDQQHKTAANYIDVRVDGRAYYQ